MRSAVITSGEHWLTIDGIEYLRGTIETIERLTYLQGDQEAIKISGSSVNASVILVNGTTIDGTEVSNQSELVDFIKQYSFKKGGGDGGGGDTPGVTVNWNTLEGKPTGDDRDTAVFDAEGNIVARRIGWKQLSDLPSPPPFPNGVYTGTAFHPDGKALFAFIQLNDSGEPLASAIPLTDGNGSTPTAPATQTYHAVPLSQMTEALEGKVDKIEGYGLTPEPFTQQEKDKLASVEDPKFQGQFSSEAELQANGQGGAGNYAYVDGGEGEPIHLYAWNNTGNTWDLVAGESTAETPSSVLMKYESNPDRNAFTDADREKLDGIAPGAQVNLPATSIPTLNDVVARNPFTDRSFHLSKNGVRVGLEDVPGSGPAISGDALDNSGFIRFDGEKWIASTNIGGFNNVVFQFAGRANVNTPTAPSNIANKAYVDSMSGQGHLSRTVERGVTITEYTNRTEYTVKIPISRTVAAPPNNFATATTTAFLPEGITIAGCDEHYISIRNDNRSVIISAFDNPTDRNIRINFWNVWTGSANVIGSVFIKLVNFK